MYRNHEDFHQYEYHSGPNGTYYYGDSSFRPEPSKKKNRRGLRILALALSCAVLGGACGFVGGRLAGRQPSGTASVAVSNRLLEEVELVEVNGKQQMSMSEVYAANVNQVVSINTSTEGYNAFGQRVESASSGSGFIITEDGYIVTNYHVVEGASSVTVTLYDGTDYKASVVGGDEDYDICVLKIEATGLPTVVLGNSDGVNVGDSIAAIGNPLGELTFSMSVGSVSCVNRAINVDGTPFNTIQIDASINPGNSGGPLFNAYGEVIGIVSAKYSSYGSTTVEGVGFAIPMNDVVAMIQDIMTNGFVSNKPYLGITGGTINDSMAQQQGMTKGVYVYSLEAGGAAERAGVQIGDIITAIDGNKITSMEDLNAVKKSYQAGDTATFTLSRQGEERTVELTFDSAPQEELSQQTPQIPNHSGGSSDYGDYYDMWSQFFGSMFPFGY